MQSVPLKAVPSQTLTTTLNNQLCNINVYQKASGLYFDLLLNGSLVIGGVLCENRNRLVRSAYLGFSGDFAFVDSEGDSDPYFTGLGGRFSLVYLLPSEA